MFKVSIFVILLPLIGVSCTTAQIPRPASTPDRVYLAAVREFARAIVRVSRDSTLPFFLEDSVDSASPLDLVAGVRLIPKDTISAIFSTKHS